MTQTNPVSSAPQKRSAGIRTTPGEKVFAACNAAFFVLLGITTLFPFLNLLAKSLSSKEAVIAGKVTLIPVDLQFSTYRYVLRDELFLNSFGISIFVTVTGTLLCLSMTSLAAYPLSKQRLRGRKFYILMYVFTMLFSGGLIPTYLLMHTLHLIDSLPVLFLPAMISVFNLLVIKNYFESLPESLEESAKMDGASNLTILVRITLPLSLPVLATIALFYAVYFWNDYFTSMIYINSAELKPLQLYLKELLISAYTTTDKMNLDDALNQPPQSIQATSILLATVPILVVYPFLQKYFVKGVLVGSVKG